LQSRSENESVECKKIIAHRHNIKVEYKTFERAFENLTWGSPEIGYNLVRPLLKEFVRLNERSYFNFVQSSNPPKEFDYCFLCPSASINAFRSCFPMIFIDACFLKGKYASVMMFACFVDAENTILPLAIAIAPEEIGYWERFVKDLKEAIPRLSELGAQLIFMSDRTQQLASSLMEVKCFHRHGVLTVMRTFAEISRHF
jgi:hypothetical protein